MEDPFSDTSDEPIKVIAFCRVAAVKQSQQDKAFEAQKQQITKTAARLDYEIVAWFQQVGSSTNSWEDIALKEAHDYCLKNPDVSYLLATEPSRISRSLSGFHYWEDSFYAHGVGLCFTDMGDDDYVQAIIKLTMEKYNAQNAAAKKAKDA